MGKILGLLGKTITGILLLLTFYISAYDIWLLIQGRTQIENLYWFLGQIPGSFAIIYLLYLRKQTRIFRKLTFVLGFATFLVSAYIISISDFIQLEYLLVAIFAIIVSVRILMKNFIDKIKAKRLDSTRTSE